MQVIGHAIFLERLKLTLIYIFLKEELPVGPRSRIPRGLANTKRGLMRIINRENESSDNTVHRDNTTHHDNTTHRDNAAYSANTAHHDNASHHDSGCGNHSYGWTSCKGREIQTKATKTGYLVLYVFHFNLNCMNCRNAVSSRSEGRPTKHSLPPTKLTNLSSAWKVE